MNGFLTGFQQAGLANRVAIDRSVFGPIFLSCGESDNTCAVGFPQKVPDVLSESDPSSEPVPSSKERVQTVEIVPISLRKTPSRTDHYSHHRGYRQ